MKLRRDHILTPEAIFHVVVVVAIIGLAAAVLQRSNVAVPVLSPETHPINIVPASGVEGFNVAAFCADPATKVLALPAPDAVNSVTYQLTRDKGGVFEAVVVPGNLMTGTHFYDSAIGQQSEPGALTDEARACVKAKAK